MAVTTLPVPTGRYWYPQPTVYKCPPPLRTPTFLNSWHRTVRRLPLLLRRRRQGSRSGPANRRLALPLLWPGPGRAVTMMALPLFHDSIPISSHRGGHLHLPPSLCGKWTPPGSKSGPRTTIRFIRANQVLRSLQSPLRPPRRRPRPRRPRGRLRHHQLLHGDRPRMMLVRNLNGTAKSSRNIARRSSNMTGS